MTTNGGSSEKSPEERQVPTAQEADQRPEVVNTTVAPSAPLARANPRQEEQRPRQNPSSSHVRVQLGGPRGTSMPPPPPPPPRTSQGGGGGGGSAGKVTISGVPVVTGGGIRIGGNSEGAGITIDSQSGARPQKRKSEVVAPAGIRPICSVCRRDFYSWKALFGHMRSHPERGWRGCFPPPVDHPEQPTGATDAGAEKGEGSGARGLDIDLNQPQEPVIDLDAGERPPAEKKDSGPADIDINKPPPSDDDDIA